MAWATCYPRGTDPAAASSSNDDGGVEVTTGSSAHVNFDDDDDGGGECELGEDECLGDGRLCSGPATFQETQTATVSLVRELDAGDDGPPDPCAAGVGVGLGAAGPFVAAIEGSKRAEAAGMRSRRHFRKIPGPPPFLRSASSQRPSPGVCGVTRESARLKVIKDLSPALYKHGTVFEQRAKDFYKKDYKHYEGLRSVWDQMQGDCVSRSERIVRQGEPELIRERDSLRRDICTMLATIECFNDEITKIMECDEYRLAVIERAELLDKLAKYSSEVKRQDLLLDLAKEEYQLLLAKDRTSHFVKPELVGKCECSEYSEVLQEITQLTIDNDQLSTEYQLWEKLIKDFTKSTRELLRTMITDWNPEGELHKAIRSMVCFSKECVARDMLRCIFACPEPEHIAKLLCCELDCVVNAGKLVRQHYSGI